MMRTHRSGFTTALALALIGGPILLAPAQNLAQERPEDPRLPRAAERGARTNRRDRKGGN